jgi:holo-[acyl-carrier protein] synthase
MILGTGIDIIEVARIASSYEKFGERFVNRILHAGRNRLLPLAQKSRAVLAARFAAKEAVSKAFGTGIGARSAGRTWRFAKRIGRTVRGPARQRQKII